MEGFAVHGLRDLGLTVGERDAALDGVDDEAEEGDTDGSLVGTSVGAADGF